ncbi:MAG TPA: CDP-alcohol phosphatidyltransferase family protein [Candidatus Acidoferrum sp.]|nr:CDP-alcohol phosphatidyltransferase family protein [Candidatus Acidoferrum sp.]
MTQKQKEIFSVPNIMSYSRILLIPVFVYVYLRADTYRDYAVSGAIVAVSGLTDFLDGFIARRFDMITELGKALDPVADKLTQAAVALCLMLRIPQMGWLVGVLIIKESFMGISAALLLQYNKKMDGSKWFGKVSTFIYYVVMSVLLFFPGLPASTNSMLIALATVGLFVAFVMYIPIFIRMWSELRNTEDRNTEE